MAVTMSQDHRAMLESVRSELRDALSAILDAQRRGGVHAMWFVSQAQHRVSHAAENIDRILSEIGQE